MESLIKLIAEFIAASTLVVPAAFTTMILLGIAHGEESWVPAPGYLVTYILIWALSTPVAIALATRDIAKELG